MQVDRYRPADGHAHFRVIIGGHFMQQLRKEERGKGFGETEPKRPISEHWVYNISSYIMQPSLSSTLESRISPFRLALWQLQLPYWLTSIMLYCHSGIERVHSIEKYTVCMYSTYVHSIRADGRRGMNDRLIMQQNWFSLSIAIVSTISAYIYCGACQAAGRSRVLNLTCSSYTSNIILSFLYPSLSLPPYPSWSY
ncbi:hypothetical protein BDBG_18001 [Blastomyces gilchristii SLH14081]|uniref:Uncharacterized protein n=1 Tax=Blastomyces gilchristii (strain SLH14081) TaxID=559298 RepID=A0A179V217_BLAGS|nr:uncharacterized protein BDBG_18001 [Blastomyces gilchristii SLH14081]OAT14356.1 hypothetical protein BDBG_18001 [Blastomyces gilchristii SLH14081]